MEPKSTPIAAMHLVSLQWVKQLTELLEQLSSFSHEFAHLGSALKRLLRVGPVLERILIATGGSRSMSPTVHSAPPFSLHRRRAAGVT
jgi:hypothetical protein